ncbi:MAG: hypothetical protein KDC23_02070 [Actinobacteria bacterium]|nr:hypothetical protein [Actinomycetota bacterium]
MIDSWRTPRLVPLTGGQVDINGKPDTFEREIMFTVGVMVYTYAPS